MKNTGLKIPDAGVQKPAAAAPLLRNASPQAGRLETDQPSATETPRLLEQLINPYSRKTYFCRTASENPLMIRVFIILLTQHVRGTRKEGCRPQC